MNTIPFKTIPINSLVLLPEQSRALYIQKTLSLPKKIQDPLFSDNTAAYLRGLGKSYNIDEILTPNIALVVLRYMIGEISNTQIPDIFTKELKISDEQAQKMAIEIKHDIFNPIQKELDEYLSKQKGAQQTPTRPSPAKPTLPAQKASLPSNLLDLKEITAAKKQEQLSPKPKQQALPPKPPQFPLPPRIPKPPTTPISFTG